MSTQNEMANPDPSNTVLVVDLDGTLCLTDTLQESLLAMAGKSPWQLARVPGWIAGGRANLKEKLADQGILDPSSLPLNKNVLDLVREARDAGRRTALVSAADHRQVTAVAQATGLFDEAYGTAEGRNLKGEAKAAFLNTQYGAGGYDYVGDARADLPVWASAHQAITVRAGSSLRKQAETVNANTRHISPPSGKLLAVLAALRPHQWSKNILLFLPLLASHDFSSFFQVVLGFVAFCTTASTVYVINDLMDLAADRSHPRKRFRPFASGALSGLTGVILAAVLAGLALLLGYQAGSPLFLAVMIFYFAATFVYSLWLKRKLIIDVLMLGGLFTTRIVAGAAVASVPLSPWMLGFSVFIFLALAAIKRQTELTDQLATGRESSGRAYEVEDLPVLRGVAISAANAAVLILALYLSSDTVQALYVFPGLLWAVCPMLLYWILRMVMKTHRGQMSDDPIVFAMTDRVSQGIIAACIATGFAAATWPWPVLSF